MKQKSLRIGILLLGLLLVAGSIYFLMRPTQVRQIRDGIGWIERQSGELEILEVGNARRIQSREILRSGNSILSFSEAEALIRLHDGTELRLLENSHISFEESKAELILVLKSGTLRVDEVVTPKKVIISKNGQRIYAEEFEASRVFREPTLPPTGQIAEAGAATRLPPSEKDINEQFQKNKQALFKCYGQLLQKSQSAKGEVTLSFEILESGKTSNLMIQPVGESESLKDPSFQKCLSEVISRIEFPSFRGDRVSTIYPLRFE